MQGKLIIFSGPSGAGKTTIVHRLLAERNDIEFSVSACSRPKRSNETDGVDYYFLSVEEFKKKIADNDFLEWQEVYKDSFYGTLKSEVERIWAKGKYVIFDVDVVGGLNIKKYDIANALAVFVMPPSVEELEKRLVIRSSETSETLKKRIDKANYEMTFAPQFDEIIINESLETAYLDAKEAITKFLCIEP